MAFRVLVYEPDPDLAEAYRELLPLWGYETRVCRTPADLRSALAHGEPQVCLCRLDPGEREMEGIVREAVRPAGRPAARFVALAAVWSSRQRRTALRSGFDLYLKLPVLPELLRQLLDGERAHFRRQDAGAAGPGQTACRAAAGGRSAGPSPANSLP